MVKGKNTEVQEIKWQEDASHTGKRYTMEHAR